MSACNGISASIEPTLFLDLNRVAELEGVRDRTDDNGRTLRRRRAGHLDRAARGLPVASVRSLPRSSPSSARRRSGMSARSAATLSTPRRSPIRCRFCSSWRRSWNWRSAGGRRRVNINDFYHGYKQFDLRPDELLAQHPYSAAAPRRAAPAVQSVAAAGPRYRHVHGGNPAATGWRYDCAMPRSPTAPSARPSCGCARTEAVSARPAVRRRDDARRGRRGRWRDLAHQRRPRQRRIPLQLARNVLLKFYHETMPRWPCAMKIMPIDRQTHPARFGRRPCDRQRHCSSMTCRGASMSCASASSAARSPAGASSRSSWTPRGTCRASWRCSRPTTCPGEKQFGPLFQR